MTLLIVNADDFGLNQSANAGIMESFLVGGVTSTTIMANGEAFEEAIGFALCNPELAVGLHFNLTWGKPLSRPDSVVSLVDGCGDLITRKALGIRAFSSRLRADEIRRELDSQFTRLTSVGLRPSHIDSHQHVHCFPAVFMVVAEFCREHDLPLRVPWIGPTEAGSLARHFRRTMLKIMLSRATRPWRGRLRWNDSLGSVFELGEVSGALDDHHYRELFRRATGDSFELMVHPVVSADSMRGYTRVGSIGELEFHYLKTGRLAKLADECGFRLGTYRDLPGTLVER